MEEQNGFVKSIGCDATSTPKLNLEFNDQYISGAGNKMSAVILSAIGISLPFILITTESPIIFAFLVLPANNLEYSVDFEDEYEIVDKKYKRMVRNNSFTNDEAENSQNLSYAFKKQLNKIIKNVREAK